jgi:hypothetical protein
LTKFSTILIKMKKTNSSLLALFIFFLAFSGCQSVREGLGGSKKTNNDEFLVEKKNPLTKPPDYEDLPTPGSAEDRKEIKDEDFNLKELLEQSSKNTQSKTNTESKNKNLEKSILDKIKNN